MGVLFRAEGAEIDVLVAPSIMENEKSLARPQSEVPARRLGAPRETAELAPRPGK